MDNQKKLIKLKKEEKKLSTILLSKKNMQKKMQNLCFGL